MTDLPKASKPRTGPRPVLRRALDAVYDGAGVLGAACLLAIFAVILAQMVARWSGLIFPGAADYAGYLMAAASFLTFAHAMNRGAHIRVSLLLSALGPRRRWAEAWCLAFATLMTGTVAWYACRAVYWSRKLHDVSQGQDATPLWIVQLPMAAGAILLALCMADNLVTLLLTGRDNITEDDLPDQPQADQVQGE
ncbi:TRAP transporter small permease [Frigidibacter sp. MR17.24]|uniref:TRAP transporter small permease n=1 Tax=Frigidibacter sp. MR17.24 TaxID=3127345 RepID=UPI003012EE3D